MGQMSSRQVIAAGDLATAEAAREILETGGNAFDAAVAAVFTAMVSEPGLTSAGGGGHFMAAPESSEPILFDFFVDMPSKLKDGAPLDFSGVQVDFGDDIQEFHIGRGSAAVPGNIAGLLHVHEKLGTVSRQELLAPAIRAAKEGVVLSAPQAFIVKILKPILTHEPRGAEIFAPVGVLLQAGDRIVMSRFGDFLEALAREGEDLFYRGEVARIVVEWARDGGLLQAGDLMRYRVRERSPLVTDFLEHQVLLNPPPAQSGILIDMTLSLLDELARKETVSLTQLVTAFDITNQARQERLPGGLTDSISQPLSKQECFKDYQYRFAKMAPSATRSPDPPSRGATTHVSVMDKAGNAASVTTTNGEGCGHILPKVGFMLNNMLGEADLNPRGFHAYPAGTRLPTMVAPTIVFKGSSPVLVTGSAGSNRIRSVIVQLLVNFLYEGMGIEAATEAPRVHLEGHVLHTEPRADEEDHSLLEERYRFHRWEGQNVFFGGANSVTPSSAAADARRGGHSIVLS